MRGLLSMNDSLEWTRACKACQLMTHSVNIRLQWVPASHIRVYLDLGHGCLALVWRVRSSAVEYYVDIVGVTGSIPVAPTITPLSGHT